MVIFARASDVRNLSSGKWDGANLSHWLLTARGTIRRKVIAL
jgi:hypothetical protein